MADTLSLSAIKPVSLMNRSIKVNFKELFKSLGKATIQGAFGNWGELTSNGYEALSALGFEKKPEEIAWLLIYRSISQAVFNLIEESKELLLNFNEINIEALTNRLDLSLEDKEIIITYDFLRDPKKLNILEDIRVPLSQWLDSFGLSESQIKSINDRLPNFFVFAIHEEWKRNVEEYKGILDYFDTPFLKASERELSWIRYTTFLRKEVDRRMFDEAFSLTKVYVPLRAFYLDKTKTESELEEQNIDSSKTNKVVVDLEAELESWIHAGDKDDAIRIISGGPGSGKSSFGKIFTTRLAERSNIPVLYIPLHHFEIKDDLVDAVGKYVKYDKIFNHNPLDPENGEERLLIFFDGLDELSKQGTLASEIAKDFIEEVQRKLDRFNLYKLRLQIVMTGRELSIQEIENQFRKPKQIFAILPYYIPVDQRKEYKGPKELIKIDQRKIWWELYGLASGRKYTTLPEELDKEDLIEITSQPLLNYLLALSYDRGRIDFSSENNLNNIYKDLLTAVYERGWANSKHPSLRDVSEESFIRILETISISVWHGSGRTASINEIESYCNSNGLKKMLSKFQEGSSKGVTRLLTAFYFRQSNANFKGENTFEFTHKSFGEYLVSKRIVSVLRQINKKMAIQDVSDDDEMDEKAALILLSSLCGPGKLDGYVYNFLNNEINLTEKIVLIEWQNVLVKLINYVLRYGTPVDRLDPRPNFSTEKMYAIHVEETLIILISLISKKTKLQTSLEWISDINFGSWLKTLCPQRKGPKSPLVMHCLNNFNLSGQTLEMIDLYAANLSESNLSNTRLLYANLGRAKIKYTNSREALFNQAYLQFADFTGSDFTKSKMSNVRASRAKFTNCDLTGVTISNSDFSGGNFNNSKLCNIVKGGNRDLPNNFSEANLSAVDLSDSDFENDRFTGAKLKRAMFRNANLTRASLDGADLSFADLTNANLTYVNFDKANLKGAIFDFSYCKLDFKDFESSQSQKEAAKST